jgi:hypothetical protein
VFPSRAALELGGLAARQEARKHSLHRCRSGILNVRPMLLVGMVEEYLSKFRRSNIAPQIEP